MRAAGVTEFGGPEALRLVDVPREPLGPGQVRVRVTAAAVNPTDTYARNGTYAQRDPVKEPPYVPGMDVAGTLSEIGDGADTDIHAGEHVMGIVVPSGAHGGYREDVVLPAGSIARVPEGVGDAAAATLPMNGLTARLALDRMALQPGQVLAVTGAAGAFGGYVVQLAKTEGLTVVADAKAEDEQLVRDLGADVVVRRGDDVADRIREQFPDGVDGLADGSVQDAAVLPAVKDGGAVATVRGYRGDGQRDLRVFPVMVRDYAEEHAKLDRLREQVEKGEITLRVAQTFPAAKAAEAHRRLEAGGVRGRLVLTF
ncbi:MULTISPECIES: quinone oxidoreductase family protein [unclassified Modestobacter]|uniref:quinone oxidoreductase family protein n=1 Tax=unclassified Modestobacter TaxID=2643866 RepID=UPI0022AA3F2E|nr:MULTISPECIES: NADP-dependent oxidoreductase [unclassified Modestobacter]MCZ2819340.1 NADP-dependent oxidoreductase [Modestobacter sp. VKM Ac-2977]MCZ2850319.1 NADP-dependent oxidoreductase [Modestobacter sp. VKM Ac-2978]